MLITLIYAERGLGLLPMESIDRVKTLQDGDQIDELGLLALRCSMADFKADKEYIVEVQGHKIRLDHDGKFLDLWPLPDYRYLLLYGEDR